MEYIKYPSEHKLQTAQRVTYNAEVTKYYDGQKLAKITATDLDNAKLRKLLLDITGLTDESLSPHHDEVTKLSFYEQRILDKNHEHGIASGTAFDMFSEESLSPSHEPSIAIKKEGAE